MNRITVKALPAVSDLEIDSDIEQARSGGGGGRGSSSSSNSSGSRGGGRRELLWQRLLAASAITSTVVTSGGTTASQGSQGALLAVAPRPTTSSDMLAGRPMDSRTVSIGALQSNGAPVGTVTLASNLTIVIPLRDLSIVSWNPATGSARGVNVGQAAFISPTINITCPSSPTAATTIKAVFVVAGPGGTTTPGSPANVTLKKATLVSFTGVNGQQVSVAAGATSGADSLAGPSTASLDTLSTGQATTTTSSSYSYLLTANCGPAFEAQTVACGVGMEGAVITFACPAVQTVPVCVWWDTAARGWSNAGTAVIPTPADPTSITCTTTRLADHAVKFTAVPQIQADIFSVQLSNTVVKPMPFSPGPFILASLACALFIALAFLYARQAHGRKWVAALEGGAGGVFEAVKRRALESGKGWKLDGWAVGGPGGAFGGGSGGSGAKVSPEMPSLPPSPAALKSAEGSKSVASTLLARVTQACGVGEYMAALAGYEALKGGDVVMAGPQSLTLPLIIHLTLSRLMSDPPATLMAVWHLLPLVSRFYHPHLPAAAPAITRALVTLASLFTGLMGMMVMYLYLMGAMASVGTLALPGLGAGQFIALALASSLFVTLPLDIVLTALLHYTLKVDAVGRFPEIGREVRRREAGHRALAPMSTPDLLGLCAGGDDAMGSSPQVGALVGEIKRVNAFPLPPPPPVRFVYIYTLVVGLLSTFSLFYVTSFTLVRGPTAAVLSVGASMLGWVAMLLLLRPLEVLVRVAFAVVVSKSGGGRQPLYTLTLAIPCYAFPLASATENSKPLSQALPALPPLSSLCSLWFAMEGGGAAEFKARAALCNRVYMEACALAHRVLPPAPPPPPPSSPTVTSPGFAAGGGGGGGGGDGAMDVGVGLKKPMDLWKANMQGWGLGAQVVTPGSPFPPSPSPSPLPPPPLNAAPLSPPRLSSFPSSPRVEGGSMGNSMPMPTSAMPPALPQPRPPRGPIGPRGIMMIPPPGQLVGAAGQGGGGILKGPRSINPPLPLGAPRPPRRPAGGVTFVKAAQESLGRV